MVTFSDRFYDLSGRVTTFAGIALCLKVIPLKAVTVSDVNIEFEDRAVVVGILAALALYLMICVAVETTKDISRQINKDRSGPVTIFADGRSLGMGEAEQGTRSHRVYLFAARLSIALEVGFPILFGSFVVILCFSEMLSFSRRMISVITSAF
ncbi:hypothetical protein GOZ78_17855 [Agrobacterium vitis]|uniref:Uncharacterized protein n=1 Tax=Agrobacterium vitis TaxID=373 RepID=A0ABD6GDZ8_AGRVI|nr:hypothetical protein [Agrobacterium vitis]MUO79694.1 hypothetical protein [Agrobacterium vitis]MUO96846.1 hypothetical protein [Agrobacterium vitis]MUP07693.1 hypothetical protein [Agrobacterium vitis]MUZ83623.1 hypothetical protein [Agrobacterium vitis]MVA11886.1 hypothetical protein [Agrobacterium vitis]